MARLGAAFLGYDVPERRSRAARDRLGARRGPSKRRRRGGEPEPPARIISLCATRLVGRALRCSCSGLARWRRALASPAGSSSRRRATYGAAGAARAPRRALPAHSAAAAAAFAAAAAAAAAARGRRAAAVAARGGSGTRRGTGARGCVLGGACGAACRRHEAALLRAREVRARCAALRAALRCAAAACRRTDARHMHPGVPLRRTGGGCEGAQLARANANGAPAGRCSCTLQRPGKRLVHILRACFPRR